MNENVTVRTADLSDIDILVKFRFLYQSDAEGGLTEMQKECLAKQLPGYFREHIGKDGTVHLGIVYDQDPFPCMLFLHRLNLLFISFPARTRAGAARPWWSCGSALGR